MTLATPLLKVTIENGNVSQSVFHVLAQQCLQHAPLLIEPPQLSGVPVNDD